MEDERKDHLLKTLEKLDEDELKLLLHQLNQTESTDSYRCIAFRIPDVPDAEQLTDFLLDNYGVDSGIEETVKVLKAMNLESLAKELVEFHHNAPATPWPTPASAQQKENLGAAATDAPSHRVSDEHFVDKHRDELIQHTSRVDDVLYLLKGIPWRTSALFPYATKEPRDVSKMQKLYELMPLWDRTFKDNLYHSLLVTNRYLIEDLKGVDFFKKYKEELIRQVSWVDGNLQRHLQGILNDAEYEAVMAESTGNQKMEKLYELLPSWDRRRKGQLYRALESTNRHLILQLEDEHFVDKGQYELIQHASEADEFFHLLEDITWRPSLLFHYVTKEPRDVLKMQKLYEKLPLWDRAFKDNLYHALLVSNRYLIEDLKGVDFFKKYKEELIRQVSWVDGNLQRHLQGILNDAEYEAVMAESTGNQKMEKLYELLPSWDRRRKGQLYRALESTNRHLILQLEDEHFVDKHRDELIQHTSGVDEVFYVLEGITKKTSALFPYAMKEPTDVLQMQKLYELMTSWGRTFKDNLYHSSLVTNRILIEDLNEEHFIEKHQEELIHRVSRVDAILRRLPAQHSLIKEGSDQQKMEKLYTLVTNWSRKEKDHLYMVLKKTNGPLVAELEEGHFVERHKEHLIQNATKVNRVAQSLVHNNICRHFYIHLLEKDTDQEKMELLYKLVPDWNGEWKNRLYKELRATNELVIKELEGRRSSKEGLVPTFLAEEKCYLCEKDKGVPEVQPELIADAKGEMKTYRIHLPRAGTFLCSVTELTFEVRAAVTVKYTYSSWDQHLSETEMQTWMVAGPLFDIHADPVGEVAAVHLPHFICLQEGKTDISQMKIAHFIDAGMTLEKPSRVTQFHAVLENPEFSVLGVLLNPIQRFIPVHSVVLLYKTCRKTITLHLYLVPNDLSLIQAIDDREKSRKSVLVDKHPQTDEPLYYGSRYIVFSSVELQIEPKELEFSYKTPRQLQSFVDVYLGNIERVKLGLKKKEGLLSVWDAWLESEDVLIQEEGHISITETEGEKRGDLDLRFQALSLGSQCDSNSQTQGTPVSSEAGGTQETLSLELHFIEQHREQLIQRTVPVEGVLDLLYKIVLDDEQYERIFSRKTSQDKMRELYRLVPSWDRSCKDLLYGALKKKTPHLIADLEGR